MVGCAISVCECGSLSFMSKLMYTSLRSFVHKAQHSAMTFTIAVTSRNCSIHFSLFYPMLTFSLRLMVTYRLDSCDHLLYRLVTRYVPCLYFCRDSFVPCDLLYS